MSEADAGFTDSGRLAARSRDGVSLAAPSKDGAMLAAGGIPMPVPATPLLPYPDFATASREVVGFLNTRVPLAVWNVTRAEGRIIVTLQTSPGNGYGVKPGDSMVYAESMCSRVVAGEAPNITPDIDAEPALRDVPVRKVVPVNTYVSFPLQRADGSLFGTLCGWDPIVSSPTLLAQQPLLELLSRQLSTILQFDLDREAAWRLAVQHEASAMTDPLTGLGNRRAFDLLCGREEARCRDIGQRITAIQLDLDDLKATNDRDGHAAGDALLQRAAAALREAVRKEAHVARIGGDEFAVLLPGCGLAEGLQVGERVRAALADAGVRASIGAAERKPHRGLAEAIQRADAAMYADKATRKSTT
jgi:diguanylate cyclase